MKKRWFYLNIGRKLFLGYLILALFTILNGFVALHYLEKLNTINESIGEINIPLKNTTDQMIENIYSQELYGQRYAILKSKQMMDLFQESNVEFKKQIDRVRSLLVQDKTLPRRITTLHDDYTGLFLKWFESQSGAGSTKTDYHGIISKKQDRLIRLIQRVSDANIRDQNQKNRSLSMIGGRAFTVIAIICLFSIIAGMGAAIVITRNISHPLGLLKNATREISNGNFNQVPDINKKDEIGDLAHSFKEMAKRLKNLEEMYLDANPLTRLPGSVAIENVLKKRLESRKPLAFCLIDLDHFKVFNDHYGYSRGNKVIKATANLLEDAIDQFGDKNDFLGHIGGDDFVMVTGIGPFRKICQFIIESFDEMIPRYYDRKDLKRGYIEAKSRSGKKKKFSVMTVSIAVVTTKNRIFKHHVQVIEVATELKGYAKTFPGSHYLVDRRKPKSN